MGSNISIKKMSNKNKNINRIALGTVQFGLNYGISNREGITPEAKVGEMLKYAWEKGVHVLDTAASYGNSEDVIGRNITQDTSFRILTKTPIFEEKRIDKRHAEKLINTFYKSLERMKQSTLYGLFVHHGVDLLKDGGQHLWDAMEDLKREGLVKKIGASAYSPMEINELLNKYHLDLAQLPLNVFDQRILFGGYLQHFKKHNIEIHGRSVFLQGLLLMPIKEIPEYFNPFKPLLKRYHSSLREKGISMLNAAMGFVYGITNIDHILVGINNCQQLKEIIETVNNLHSLDQIDFSEYSITNESLINPSLWKTPQ